MLSETLAVSFLEKLNLPNFTQALKDCHFPSKEEFNDAEEKFKYARKRFVIEELFAQKVSLSIAQTSIKKNKSFPIDIDDNKTKIALSSLQFSLTDSQKQALQDIKKSYISNTQSMRLIQGDVG